METIMGEHLRDMTKTIITISEQPFGATLKTHLFTCQTPRCAVEL